MKRKGLASFLLLFLLLGSCFFALNSSTLISPAGHSPAPAPVSQGSTLTVRFLDVGEADAALVTCGGSSMLIDGGEPSSSSFLVAYLRELGIEHLEYMVCTHPHSDHAGGLSGPLNTCTVSHILSSVEDDPSTTFQNLLKYAQKQQLSVEVPSPGDSFSLGEATVTILGPLRKYDDVNDASLVLRIDFGETSFLFAGDMGLPAEEDLLDSGAFLSADVLKVGHHGSNTSTGSSFLQAVSPASAVLSVGSENKYGHPSEAVSSLLRQAGCVIYRTDLNGTITAVSDGKSLSFTVDSPSSIQSPSSSAQPTSSQDLLPPDDDCFSYIGNRRSKVFHSPACPNLPAQQNQVYFSSREEALDQGYTPCGNCDP